MCTVVENNWPNLSCGRSLGGEHSTDSTFALSKQMGLLDAT